MKTKKFFIYASIAILVAIMACAIWWLGKVSLEGLEKNGADDGAEESYQKLQDRMPEGVQMIMVDKPKANSTVSSPLEIRGEARGGWYFEGSFPVRLVGEGGNVLASGTAKAVSDWMTTDFVPFEASLDFDAKGAGSGMLVFEKNNPSGLEENGDSFSVPVFFENGSEKTTVKVFFGNSDLDPERKNCWTVYAVSREVEKTTRIAQAAIEELLKGATEEEKSKGYFSSIQEGTKLNGASVQHQVAFIDFNEKLDQGLTDSCTIMTIRSQIEQTLKQFPTVDDVQIYVGERSEDVLIP